MSDQFVLILPEIILVAIAMCGQMLAVFYKENIHSIIFMTLTALSCLVLWLIYSIAPMEIGFTDSFETSELIWRFKALILGLTITSVVTYKSLVRISGKSPTMEFITLILFSTVGIFISISARDFVLLFSGLELQALCGYALAAFNISQVKSSEAGLKYFILGVLISCLMLFGISFIYGFGGSLNFREIQNIAGSDFNIGLVIGLILVLAALLFKLSAAPLHIWTPDVYEGAPISAVTYFAAAQKIGVLVVLINFITLITGEYTKTCTDIIKVSAILSIAIGSLGAIMQSSLKRLMAYSTVLNTGYVLIGVALNTEDGIYAALLYMLVYGISALGFFACLIALFGDKSDIANFDDLRGIAAERKTIAATIAIIMFSMIGLPPLAGFFAKYYIFYNAVAQGEVLLALLGVLASVIAAFYYLKVIKYMYFLEADKQAMLIATNGGLLSLSVISVGFILFSFIFASPLSLIKGLSLLN